MKKRVVPRLAYANQKGGPGKTTMTIQHAFELSRLGKRVLVIDFDSQGNTSTRLSGYEDLYDFDKLRTLDLYQPELPSGYSILTGKRGIDIIYSLKNDEDLDEIERSVDPGIAAFPAKHIIQLADNYDWVLMDCPPNKGNRLYGALLAATAVIAPLGMSGFAVTGAEGISETLIHVRDNMNSNLKHVAYLINQKNTRSPKHSRTAQSLRDMLGSSILRTEIAHRQAIDDANEDGEPIWTYRNGSARLAAAEVKSAIHEIIKLCEGA